MPDIRISSTVDADAWSELRRLARESDETVSRTLTDAIREYVARHRERPAVPAHLDQWIREHDELGRRLSE